ncbi:MAG: YifB family Mg chelatase-like AAA ATPase [Armatimonadota bacterium]|nr:MAG: YifB family Mg chelatase-like AAA ATPase [Armatimonadota bacterium]
MLARIDSCAVLGIDAHLVQTQVDVGSGMASFTVVGLPDLAVQESRERVRSAIRNSRFSFPAHRVTVNLAPADIRKEGPAFDLPIALAVLAATEQIASEDMANLVAAGELSLDGSVRPISGVLPIALAARQAKCGGLIVPADNVAEATVVEGLAVYPVRTLWEAAEVIARPDQRQPAPSSAGEWELSDPDYPIDFSEVKGQPHVKRALEVAAAGGHNVVMVGPPGAGKTMLAMRLPTILPPLRMEEALEVTKVYSISGKIPAGEGLITTRPFRSPHHTISAAGLAGGGTIPKPGEISLAHDGVLFLDELPEFGRDALEVLRQPLEEGTVNVSRVAGTATFPARVMLVAALNPCPCGYYMDAMHSCTCSVTKIRRYLQRISGPLLDRVDIHIEVPRLKRDEMLTPANGEPSKSVRERVRQAREVQAARFAGNDILCNAHMRPRDIKAFCPLSDEVRSFLSNAIDQLGLSARAFDRVVKLSRTTADLDASDAIELPHVAEAIQYRGLDRKLWA